MDITFEEWVLRLRSGDFSYNPTPKTEPDEEEEEERDYFSVWEPERVHTLFSLLFPIIVKAFVIKHATPLPWPVLLIGRA